MVDRSRKRLDDMRVIDGDEVMVEEEGESVEVYRTYMYWRCEWGTSLSDWGGREVG